MVLVLAGTAGAVAVFGADDGRDSRDSLSTPGGSGTSAQNTDTRRSPTPDPLLEPGQGPMSPRAEIACPAPLVGEPVPGPLDPRATAGNPHTLASGAVAVRLCEPPPPFTRGGPPVLPRLGSQPTTLYYDVDRVVRKVNSFPVSGPDGRGPNVPCHLDARPWVTLEVQYPDGVRASVPMNLGGCGVMVFSDTSRHGVRIIEDFLTALLEEQRIADPPTPAPPAQACEQSRPAGHVALRREALGRQGDVIPYPAAHLVACRYSAAPNGTWTLRGSTDLAAEREEIRTLVNAAAPVGTMPRLGAGPCPYPTQGFTLLRFADAAGAQYEVLVNTGECARMYMLLNTPAYGGEYDVPVPPHLLRRIDV
ncbi:hypothetical protein [Yinghuangia sp. YIM S09857]|uniref:hypothetical protein n=1 Tax=Yinghuangia sp. YIM S09857 TaxID=3436929 RepID=UPI003F53C9B3